MAHYKDGKAAALGDIVRGRGYNLPYDVQGVVVGITPGAGSCDIHVAFLRPHFPLGSQRVVYPCLDEEHGTCADFELVQRAGSVAPAPSDEDLGRVGYDAYKESTGGKTFDGRDMPTFDGILERTPHVARAWAAAMSAARKLLGR